MPQLVYTETVKMTKKEFYDVLRNHLNLDADVTFDIDFDLNQQADFLQILISKGVPVKERNRGSILSALRSYDSSIPDAKAAKNEA